MTHWIALSLGIFIGFWLGVFVCGVLIIAKEG